VKAGWFREIHLLIVNLANAIITRGSPVSSRAIELIEALEIGGR
jgi:hypothetical protein